LNTEVAILIFIQEISEDVSRKTLTPNKNLGLNKNLFQKLSQRVNHIAYETHLPVYRSNDFGKQKGSYGEQLANAIETVMAKGFEKVICLGNDCPALGKIQILEAARQLQNTETVIGPDQHGGVYLLGISKNSFAKERFQNLAWKTDKMLESYLKAFEKQSIYTMEILADIHTFHQLKTYLHANFFTNFLLQIIYKTLAQKVYYLAYSIGQPIHRNIALRAPPIF
jgi:uncharacterized protein